MDVRIDDESEKQASRINREGGNQGQTLFSLILSLSVRWVVGSNQQISRPYIMQADGALSGRRLLAGL